jgi:hypothetical protein
MMAENLSESAFAISSRSSADTDPLQTTPQMVGSNHNQTPNPETKLWEEGKPYR